MQPHADFEEALLRLVSLDPRQPASMPNDQWRMLARLAARERVAPLAWVSLRGTSASGIPEDVLDALARSYRHAEEAATRAYVILEDLLGRWRKAGVTVVIFKGAALARWVYPDAALRPFRDLDVLIGMKDVEAAHQVLRDAGYVLAGGAPTATDLTWRHGRGYYDPQKIRLSVDVHWRFAGYPNLLEADVGGIRQRARRVAVGGEAMLIPSAADMVVMCAIEFLREVWYAKPRLRYMRDLAEIVLCGAVDWSEVLQLITGSRQVRAPLYMALAASTRLLGAHVPESVLRVLQPSSTRRAESLVSEVCTGILRRHSPLDAIRLVATLRWLEDQSLAAAIWWGKALIFIPRPLAASRRRWLAQAWRGWFDGQAPPDYPSVDGV